MLQELSRNSPVVIPFIVSHPYMHVCELLQSGVGNLNHSFFKLLQMHSICFLPRFWLANLVSQSKA